MPNNKVYQFSDNKFVANIKKADYQFLSITRIGVIGQGRGKQKKQPSGEDCFLVY